MFKFFVCLFVCLGFLFFYIESHSALIFFSIINLQYLGSSFEEEVWHDLDAHEPIVDKFGVKMDITILYSLMAV